MIQELTVYVIHLCGPEQEQDKVVATAKEGDEEDDNHRGLRLREQCGRHHGVLGELDLVYEERNDEDDAENERDDIMDTAPGVLKIISLILKHSGSGVLGMHPTACPS